MTMPTITAQGPLSVPEDKGAQHLPAGTYWVGDPCYAFSNDRHDIWVEMVESQPWGGPTGHSLLRMVNVSHTRSLYWYAASGTKFGDGEFAGSDGFSYPVDSGQLGVVEYGVARTQGFDIDNRPFGMRLVEFPREFSIDYDEDGRVYIGDISIMTGDERIPCGQCGDVCYDDELSPNGYCDPCEEEFQS